jgi:hypothetical protein
MDSYDLHNVKVIAHGFRRREINGEIVLEALPKPTKEITEKIEAQAGRKLSFDGGCYVMYSGTSVSCFKDGCETSCFLSQLGGEDYCGCAI